MSNYWGILNRNPRIPLDGMEDKPKKNARLKKVKTAAYSAFDSVGMPLAPNSWSCAWAKYPGLDSNGQIPRNATATLGTMQLLSDMKDKRFKEEGIGPYGIQVEMASLKSIYLQRCSDLKLHHHELWLDSEIAQITIRLKDWEGANWDLNIIAASNGTASNVVWNAGRSGYKLRQQQWKKLKGHLTSIGFTTSFADMIIATSNSGWGQGSIGHQKEADGFILACKNNSVESTILPFATVITAFWKDFIHIIHAERQRSKQVATNFAQDPASPTFLADIMNVKKEKEKPLAQMEITLGVIEEFYPAAYDELMNSKARSSFSSVPLTLKEAIQGMKDDFAVIEAKSIIRQKANAAVFKMQEEIEELENAYDDKYHARYLSTGHHPPYFAAANWSDVDARQILPILANGLVATTDFQLALYRANQVAEKVAKENSR